MTEEHTVTDLIARLAAVPAVGEFSRPFAISPDGATVAFQWHRGADWQIYTVPLAGGEPTLLVEIDDPCCSPLYSPDGRYLYFARDYQGSERFDVYRCDLTSGAVENLLPDTPDLAPLPDADLSPLGDRIAATVGHGEGYAIAVLPAAPNPGASDADYLADYPYTETSPRWSPDGSTIACGVGTRGQDTAIAIIDLESRRQSFVGGDDTFFAGCPAWSPDGSTIAFSGGPGDHPGIGLFDFGSGRISWAWRSHHSAHSPAWSPDGAGLAFLTDHEAQTGLLFLDLGSGDVRTLSVGRGIHLAPAFTPDGKSVVCVHSGPGQPPDLFAIAVADGSVTQLTHSLPKDLAATDFVLGEHVTYTSLDHLAAVPALLVRPRKPNGAAVVIVHGGPTWLHSDEWDIQRQAFVQAGVTVIHPNYRGSTGYGRRWQTANRWLMGQGEAQDVAGAHAYLVSIGCDPRRIAVMGRSWGGFMTMAMATQYPELFACGVAGVPFFDFIDSQLDEHVRQDLRWWDQQNTGDIVKDKAKLSYYSPINHLDRVAMPLLLVGGALDPRCPPRQIADVAASLQARGMVCETVVYPDEGHEISGRENRLDYERRFVAFTLAHLGVL